MMTGPALYQSLRDIKLTTVRRAISSACYQRSALQTFGWFAFDLAQGRAAKHLTLVHKTNVLTFAGDLWQRTFDAVAAERSNAPKESLPS